MKGSKSTVIFSILSALGVVGTTALAIKATDNAQKELHDSSLVGADKLSALAPYYIPTIVSGLCTVAFIFIGGHLNKRQQLSLASAYEMASASYRQYRNQVIQQFGEGTDEEIVRIISAQDAEKVPLTGSTFMGDNCLELEGVHEEEVVFYDTMSKRYFTSTLGRVLQAEYHVNRNYTLGGEIPLNMFYEFLGLDDVEPGDYIGWGWDLAEDGIAWIDFNHTKVTNKDGSVYYRIDPLFDPLPLMTA